MASDLPESVVDGVEIDVEEDVQVSASRRGRWPRPAFAGLLVAAACMLAPAAHAAAPPTWSDEFNGGSLDQTRWSYRGTGVRHDGILTPDAVSVGGGVLTIKTYTELGKHYSGMISTLKSGTSGFEQRYGYFESRIKFSSAPGQWSAFWLQSPTIGSPLGNPAAAGVEMDIVEHRARCVNAPAPTPPATCSATNDITNRGQQGLIWDGYGPESKLAIKLSDPLAGLGNASWHTWALRWTPTNLTFYYDGAVIAFTTTPISQRSQYIILSSEIYQLFAGPIPAAGYGTRATSLTNMQVDYVRVWDEATSPVNPSAPAPAPAPSPLPPAAPADTTAPNARLFGRTSQKLRATVPVTISCPDESCLAAATGTVRVPRVRRVRGKTYRLKAQTTTIVKGTRATVRLKLSAQARIAIARALRARKRVVLTVRVSVADGAGNVRPLSRRVRLRL